MGQKSRNKRARSPQNPTKKQAVATQGQPQRASLVTSSAGFQPRSNTAAASPTSLGVNPADMRRLVILMAIVVSAFIALLIVNHSTDLLTRTGQHLARVLHF